MLYLVNFQCQLQELHIILGVSLRTLTVSILNIFRDITSFGTKSYRRFLSLMISSSYMGMVNQHICAYIEGVNSFDMCDQLLADGDQHAWLCHQNLGI